MKEIIVRCLALLAVVTGGYLLSTGAKKTDCPLDSVVLGLQGGHDPAVNDLHCRNTAGSICDQTTGYCIEFNPDSWTCGRCSPASGTISVCATMENQNCTQASGSAGNPCGDMLEEYAQKVSQDCWADCTPVTPIGPCSDYYTYLDGC